MEEEEEEENEEEEGGGGVGGRGGGGGRYTWTSVGCELDCCSSVALTTSTGLPDMCSSGLL